MAAFDAYAQTVTLLYPDGSPFNISMADLDFYRSYGLRTSINYGTQIGASFVLLLILFLFTRRDKRRSVIFCLNASSLIFNAFRSGLQCGYFTGPFYNPYSYFSGDFSRIRPADMAVSVVGDVLTLLLVVAILLSLVLQIRVICVTMSDASRTWIFVVTSTVATVAIGFRFAVVVLNSMAICALQDFLEYNWLVTANSIMQAVAIWFFCVIFTAKLGYSLMQRRKLNMRQLGPMQIIFIMACQTMIIPAIFTVLQFVQGVPELGTQTLTVCAIFLPLSAVWAGLSTDDSNIAAVGPGAHQKLLQSSLGGSTGGSSKGGSGLTKSNSAAALAPYSPMSPADGTTKKVTLLGDHEWSGDKGESEHAA